VELEKVESNVETTEFGKFEFEEPFSFEQPLSFEAPLTFKTLPRMELSQAPLVSNQRISQHMTPRPEMVPRVVEPPMRFVTNLAEPMESPAAPPVELAGKQQGTKKGNRLVKKNRLSKAMPVAA
jgi:hypothetical protein